MPRSEQTSECRRVWVNTPLRASTSSTARIGGRGAGDHVAGVLLVPWRVGDDKGAPRRREETVSNIDRDACWRSSSSPSSRSEKSMSPPVVPKRRDSRSSASSWSARTSSALKSRRPIRVDFAVVDRTAGQEAQQPPVGRHRHPDSVIGHQKYPSRFFRSIEASASLSISRPCRSERRDWRNSATISASVVASDSIAPLNG